MKNELSKQEARKLILSSQRLLQKDATTSPIDKTLNTIEHLGYIQIDTISVVQRAHHHTLWSRNPNYEPSLLDKLVEEKKVFEYWSHAAAFLPMSEYRYSLVRKQAFLTGEQKHWYERDDKQIEYVLERISNEGPLMAKDFKHTGKKGKTWSSSKPAKRALEYLFMQGDLMISSRKNFHKVYDLTQNVLAKDIDTSTPTKEEYLKFLITKYLKANAIGNATQISYLLKNTKRLVTTTLKEMYENKELIQIKVNDNIYYVLPNILNKNININHQEVKILSPFDNLLIQRKRMIELFDYNYLLECYVPENKRKYGYFCLPILYGDKLVARMDCKVDKKEKTLNINNLVIEEEFKVYEQFSQDLQKELQNFMKFNNCTNYIVHKTIPAKFKSMI